MINYSKAPWRLTIEEPHHIREILDAEGKSLMEDTPYEQPTHPIKDEDWAMMAAAPGLYAALADAVSMVATHGDLNHRWSRWMVTAREALRIAEEVPDVRDSD